MASASASSVRPDLGESAGQSSIADDTDHPDDGNLVPDGRGVPAYPASLKRSIAEHKRSLWPEGTTGAEVQQ
jgi:hypothetical protein